MKIKMILAMDENNTIGNDGDLPWKLKSDMKRFRELTTGDGFNAVVMGRKTWNSIPEKYRPLPDRLNIVMSRDSKLSLKGAEVALYDGRAIEIGYSEGCEDLWVIGGSEIYRLFYPKCDEIHLTRVHEKIEGDTIFDGINLEDWTITASEELSNQSGDDYDTTYSLLTRKE
ncbi:MAG: dihydrofolate reductase [Candidatus Thermoplasmatota archaeon]|nr:dihydrofolate reductase [Candidatus Thermoplasmatota archaeon]